MVASAYGYFYDHPNAFYFKLGAEAKRWLYGPMEER